MGMLFLPTMVLCLIVASGAETVSRNNSEVGKMEALLKAKPNQLMIREKLGLHYWSRKNYRKVIEILAPYNNEIGENSLVNLAKSYGAVGDSENEIRMLKIYESLLPKRFRPHYLLGLSLKKIEKFDEAVTQLRQSLTLAPSHRPSYNALLEVFIDLKNNYEARTLLVEMLRRFGEKPDVLTPLCKLYSADGFLKEAVSTCKLAVQKSPRTPENHVYLAQAYSDQENKSSAEKIFRTAARQFPKSEFVQYATGTYYANEKNFAAAVRYLKEATKLDGKSLRAQLTLAQSLFETKDFKTALLHFDKACRLDETKETWHEFEAAGAKLRDTNAALAEEYHLKASVCRR